MINEKDIKITPQMLTQIAEIDAFRAGWTAIANLKPAQLKSLRVVATIESIGSSNRIEGNQLSDEEIGTLFKNINKKSFKSRDEEEVAGYADLINRIFDDYNVIPLSENYIKQMHQILLKYSSKDERHRGSYKTDTNRVSAFDKDGKEIGVIFQTATPFDTPRLMSELVDWTNRNLKDPYLHPLLVIGVFIVHFLSIHPFKDGNGRMSRAMTSLLLLKNGYEYVPYASLESVIEASKNGYYAALHGTQKTIWGGKVDYTPWLEFFITSLLKQKRHLESKIEKMSADDSKLSRNGRAVLDLFNDKNEWTAADIANALNMNVNTVAKNLKTLVDKGYLTKQGATKGAWYEKANN
jgi:Fic family protein